MKLTADWNQSIFLQAYLGVNLDRVAFQRVGCTKDYSICVSII